ncbi:MAG: potassium-transporting ATPase subunit KdpC [Proteobacteria bacterium]|nr:potassium-transporting ATPase subunit KdpC [Pseudomonadota bacterium]
MKNIQSAILLFFVFTFLLGGVYPAMVTGCAQLFFPRLAAGSLIADKNGRPIGSSLIGQPFSADHYFWPRPSATGGHSYNPLASGGSNLGPTNSSFLKLVENRVRKFHATGIVLPIPSDLVLASASSLDPHISPDAALAQIPRIAKARGISEIELQQIVTTHVEDRQWGILGEPRVNVLALNLALDNLAP